MPYKLSKPTVYDGIENKFWQWMSKKGAFTNLKTEFKYLSKALLEDGFDMHIPTYDGMIEAMVSSFLNDHYKSIYHMPFSGYLLFELPIPTMYGDKYWLDLQEEWKKYARGRVNT